MDSAVLSPLHRAIRQISLYLGAAVEPFGVRAEEGHLLTYLRKYAPCPVGEVARVFGMRGSTLTSVLDRLERSGLLLRESHPRDRRSILVRLTAHGEKVAADIQKIADRFERRVRARLHARDRAGFDAVLGAIADITRVDVRPKSPQPAKEPTS
jgi:DNA-binding MarR family transcriptional regulator